MPGQPRIEIPRARAPLHAASDRTCQSIIPSSRTMHFANRPANVCVGADVSSAQAERSSAASSSRARGRHDSGIVSTGKDSIGLSTTSAGPPRPFNPCHSESLAGALARAEACPERSRRDVRGICFFSFIRDPCVQLQLKNPSATPAPFRGGITKARHVSAGSAADHARLTRHYPSRLSRAA